MLCLFSLRFPHLLPAPHHAHQKRALPTNVSKAPSLCNQRCAAGTEAPVIFVFSVSSIPFAIGVRNSRLSSFVSADQVAHTGPVYSLQPPGVTIKAESSHPALSILLPIAANLSLTWPGSSACSFEQADKASTITLQVSLRRTLWLRDLPNLMCTVNWSFF